VSSFLARAAPFICYLLNTTLISSKAILSFSLGSQATRLLFYLHIFTNSLDYVSFLTGVHRTYKDNVY